MLREELHGKGSLCLLHGLEAAWQFVLATTRGLEAVGMLQVAVSDNPALLLITLTAIGAPCSVPGSYFMTHQQYFWLSKLLESVSNTTYY